jgi:hypothetical protein
MKYKVKNFYPPHFGQDGTIELEPTTETPVAENPVSALKEAFNRYATDSQINAFVNGANWREATSAGKGKAYEKIAAEMANILTSMSVSNLQLEAIHNVIHEYRKLKTT